MYLSRCFFLFLSQSLGLSLIYFPLPFSRLPTKVGTLTSDVESAVRVAMAGQVDFRVEKKGIIHCSVGRVSFSSAQLLDNVKALMLAISETKPDAIKGRYIKHVSLSSTMGPGIPLELPTVDPSSARFMLDPKMA